MESVNKMIMLHVPTSICNLRCHYCYLAQREECYQGQQAEMKYSPEEVAHALSKKRMGGVCFINSCAQGETLLTKDIDLYYKALVQEGHYLEIVTNLTITPMIDKILQWDEELLKRVEFKCSFHYLELKKRDLLEVFAENVKKIWNAGASASIETVPSDELVPFINEIKDYSLSHFGALPHLTIARDDRTTEISNLTQMNDDEYEKIWGQFDSDFWKFKRKIFGIKQKGFCYAGKWSYTVNISDGGTSACYFERIGNIFENPDKPFVGKPIGQCPAAHCYNGHAFLTMGLIPEASSCGYGDLRNRQMINGNEWLRSELKGFFNSKLCDQNKRLPVIIQKVYLAKKKAPHIKRIFYHK